ncbi:DNA-3-methyladenine glycosylase I [Vibrio cholerae]
MAICWWSTQNQPLGKHERCTRLNGRIKSHEQISEKRGFKFVGETICYAFMQACGLVNDHLVGCPSQANPTR